MFSMKALNVYLPPLALYITWAFSIDLSRGWSTSFLYHFRDLHVQSYGSSSGNNGITTNEWSVGYVGLHVHVILGVYNQLTLFSYEYISD